METPAATPQAGTEDSPPATTDADLGIPPFFPSGKNLNVGKKKKKEDPSRVPIVRRSRDFDE